MHMAPQANLYSPCLYVVYIPMHITMYITKVCSQMALDNSSKKDSSDSLHVCAYMQDVSVHSLDTAIDNAVLVIIEQASLSQVYALHHNIISHPVIHNAMYWYIQWQEGSLEQSFQEAVVIVANDTCTTSPGSCNINEDSISDRRTRLDTSQCYRVSHNAIHLRQSEDAIFDESSTYIIPDYPQALSDSKIEIAFAVAIPAFITLTPDTANHFIPQSTLLSMGPQLSSVLAELSGAYIVGMSVYLPTRDEGRSDWSQFGITLTVLSVVFILLLLGALIG